MHHISKTPESTFNYLNWSLGSSNVHLADFTCTEYKNLMFNRLKSPFNQCSCMRICLPKADTYNDDGDLIRYAIIEIGNDQNTLYHAKPTVEFTQTTLIPALLTSNPDATKENSDLMIIRP